MEKGNSCFYMKHHQKKDVNRYFQHFHEPKSSNHIIQIVCKRKDFEIILECQRLSKNLFKILKLINDAGMIYTNQESSFATAVKEKKTASKISFNKDAFQVRNKNEEGQQRKQLRLSLNTHKATRIIWRSAYLVKKLGILKEQLRELSVNRLVGQ